MYRRTKKIPTFKCTHHTSREEKEKALIIITSQYSTDKLGVNNVPFFILVK